MTKFSINEIYSCVQGEGASVGKPSIIVRFQKCNLECDWCDSKYAIKAGEGTKLSLNEVVDRIKSLHIKNIIFTGGEPCLQDFNPITKMLDKTYTFEVETNGLILPHEKFKDFAKDDYLKYQWNISPKGKNAGYQINFFKLKFWAKLSESHPKVFFKFVISEKSQDNDIAEILDCVKTLHISLYRVYLMPEGSTFESQIHNEWLVDLCKEHHMNYCTRLHLLLHKKTKGV